MNQYLLVSCLIQKHKLETLFLDDDTVWPPEGLLRLRDDNDNIVNPTNTSDALISSTTTDPGAVGGHFSTLSKTLKEY
jgi:hypothetical protein